jgi:hypothetical protein
MNQPRIGKFREYIAGTGATTALIAGAIVAFLAVGALVAFDGSPLSGDDADGSVSLTDLPGGQAPEAAAVALGATPGAVADSPAGGAVIAAVLPGGVEVGPGATTGPGDTPGGPGTGGGDTPAAPPAPGTGSGAATGLVEDVDDTTGSLGLPPVSGATSGLTNGIDRTLNDTLNNVGGALGNPSLGDNVDGTVRGLTNGLVGRDGLTGRLLGGN